MASVVAPAKMLETLMDLTHLITLMAASLAHHEIYIYIHIVYKHIGLYIDTIYIYIDNVCVLC